MGGYDEGQPIESNDDAARAQLAQRAKDAVRRDAPIRPYEAPPRRQRGEWIARLRDWLSR